MNFNQEWGTGESKGSDRKSLTRGRTDRFQSGVGQVSLKGRTGKFDERSDRRVSVGNGPVRTDYEFQSGGWQMSLKGRTGKFDEAVGLMSFSQEWGR